MSSFLDANRERLNACPQHMFDYFDFGPEGTTPALLRCVMCHGLMAVEMAAQYARGFAAAGRDPRDVIPEFTR